MPGERTRRTLTLFLSGDVMLGRGVDQILPHPGKPQLFESYVDSAVSYVELAERAAGPIPGAAGFDCIWGDALPELARMHPANLPALAAIGTDCCVLANNHVMDWGRGGLEQTLQSLLAAGIRTAGAGADAIEASAPAIIFAHRLIDTAGVDVVHGHSSHHAKGIEVYQRKVILYGCGGLLRLTMTPMQTRRFRLNRAASRDAQWLARTMHRECQKLGARAACQPDGTLLLQWPDLSSAAPPNDQAMALGDSR